ncbi:hypothetical protein V866_002612 [Kwoniella sp. B9012]
MSSQYNEWDSPHPQDQRLYDQYSQNTAQHPGLYKPRTSLLKEVLERMIGDQGLITPTKLSASVASLMAPMLPKKEIPYIRVFPLSYQANLKVNYLLLQ